MYRGPVWFDLDLPLGMQWDETEGKPGPLNEDDVSLTGVERLHTEQVPHEVSIGGADTGYDMRQRNHALVLSEHPARLRRT